MKKISVVLGSKSPRRKEILENAGFDVTIFSADVDESYPENLNENEIAEYLSIKKAEGIYPLLVDKDQFFITADSIVVLDGIVYGKPTSREDALNTLNVLSGKVHKVYTGVCIMYKNKKHSFTELSEIKFDSISREEQEYYIDNYQPFDKAGAYGIQDWIGLCKVEWIKGTFSNIMGLPMAKLYKELMKIKSSI